MLVMHYTGMPDGQGALDWLCTEASGVSCHYLVFEDGRIIQMVPEKRRAWHAGAGSWQGLEDINSRSIGIEIVNPGHDYGYPDFPTAQIDAVIALSRDIASRHPIPPRNVVAHSDTAPGRKIDPGEKFPWQRLHKAGIGHWIEPSQLSGGRFFQLGDSGEPIAALQKLLSEYGYGIGDSGRFGEHTEKVVGAFQRHFRPSRVDGVADAQTIETLYRLLKKLNKTL